MSCRKREKPSEKQNGAVQSNCGLYFMFRFGGDY